MWYKVGYTIVINKFLRYVKKIITVRWRTTKTNVCKLYIKDEEVSKAIREQQVISK